MLTILQTTCERSGLVTLAPLRRGSSSDSNSGGWSVDQFDSRSEVWQADSMQELTVIELVCLAIMMIMLGEGVRRAIPPTRDCVVSQLSKPCNCNHGHSTAPATTPRLQGNIITAKKLSPYCRLIRDSAHETENAMLEERTRRGSLSLLGRQPRIRSCRRSNFPKSRASL